MKKYQVFLLLAALTSGLIFSGCATNRIEGNEIPEQPQVNDVTVPPPAVAEAPPPVPTPVPTEAPTAAPTEEAPPAPPRKRPRRPPKRRRLSPRSTLATNTSSSRAIPFGTFRVPAMVITTTGNGP